MKKYPQFLLFLLLIHQLTFAQTHTMQGPVTQDTTWCDTLLLTGNVTIPQGVTLTVAPGSYVEAQGYHKITCSGIIEAIGTLTDSITFTVKDTLGFSDTSTVYGGWNGFKLIQGDINTLPTQFSYCNIYYGKATGKAAYNHPGKKNSGGAIFAKHYPAGLNINHCHCAYNLAKSQGGVLCADSIVPLNITQSTFANNRSYLRGGALCIRRLCPSTIDHNLFVNNICYNFIYPFISGAGAAIYVADAFNEEKIIISNNRCYNNKAISGIIYECCIKALIYNNLLCNNSGQLIYCGHGIGKSLILNNTIASNNGHHSSPSTTCINLTSSDMKCYHNIMWNNKSFKSIHSYVTIGSGPEIAYNLVEYAPTGSHYISNNIIADPQFVYPSTQQGPIAHPGQYDWSLKDSSPCVNAGTPDTLGLMLPATDLTGNPRFYGSHIDMGAYENQNVTAITEALLHNEVVIYPNPGHEQLLVLNITGEAHLILYNTAGHIVLQQAVTGNCPVNTTRLAAGLYLYRITNHHNQTLSSGRWVKE